MDSPRKTGASHYAKMQTRAQRKVCIECVMMGLGRGGGGGRGVVQDDVGMGVVTRRLFNTKWLQRPRLSLKQLQTQCTCESVLNVFCVCM